LKASGLQPIRAGFAMEADSQCWVCSLPLAKGERTARIASLGFDVHARCAESVLRDEPTPTDDDEDAPLTI
jgi:hypothetical protein